MKDPAAQPHVSGWLSGSKDLEPLAVMDFRPKSLCVCVCVRSTLVPTGSGHRPCQVTPPQPPLPFRAALKKTEGMEGDDCSSNNIFRLIFFLPASSC